MAISERAVESDGEVRPSRRRGPARGRSRPHRWLERLHPLADRADLTELLDRETADSGEVERNLRDLARLNRLPGGRGASVAAVALLSDGVERPSVLDVGAGIGDIPLAFARRGWPTVAADAHPHVLDAARIATAEDPAITVLEADCRALPFADGTFDVAHCSLLIHHLHADDAVAALREMARVSRRGVVINDLRRGLLPFVATGVAVAALGRCRATRIDGLASVRRAYTLDELDELLVAAGLEVAWRSNPRMPRVVTASVRTSG